MARWGGRIRFRRISLCISALEPTLAITAFIGEKARWVFAIEVYVTEHGAGTVVLRIIQFIGVRAGKVLESITAFCRRVPGSFAPARYDCVIQVLKTRWARCIIISLHSSMKILLALSPTLTRGDLVK